jgi:hypothetical protein
LARNVSSIDALRTVVCAGRSRTAPSVARILEKDARRRLADFRALLDRNPREARVALDALLEGPLSFAPVQTPEGKRYAVTGKIAVGSLFTIDSVPRGTLVMVNMSGYGGLEGWTVAISLVA